MIHVPVLKKQVIKYLNPGPNKNFIDCTIGLGGHTLSILKKNAPQGKVLGLEADPELFKILKQKIENKKRLILINNSYTKLKEILKKKKFESISGILFDLGMSTWHLKKSGRGFSFMRDEPLDMRYNPNWKLTAADIVNFWPPKAIEKILKEYGEERFAKSIVKEIIKQRKESPIKTTFELVEATKKGVPGWYKHRRIPRKNSFRILRGRHSATKTFQALRIAVNNELDNLKNVLPQALDILAPQGRIVIISFHSLEDRLVKNFFKEKQEKLKTLTKKPIRPSKEEIKLNPSSRSAKLRAAQKN